jgi:hypothetical protein
LLAQTERALSISVNNDLVPVSSRAGRVWWRLCRLLRCLLLPHRLFLHAHGLMLHRERLGGTDTLFDQPHRRGALGMSGLHHEEQGRQSEADYDRDANVLQVAAFD